MYSWYFLAYAVFLTAVTWSQASLFAGCAIRKPSDAHQFEYQFTIFLFRKGAGYLHTNLSIISIP